MAHAVANEWRSQKEVILLSQVGITHTYFGRSKKVKSLVQQYLLLQMHMNGLVNTCLDNPQRLDKPKLVRSKIKELSCTFVVFRLSRLWTFWRRTQSFSTVLNRQSC